LKTASCIYKFEIMVMGAMPISTLVVLYHAGWLDWIKARVALHKHRV